jgi:hypothetical protein
MWLRAHSYLFAPCCEAIVTTVPEAIVTTIPNWIGVDSVIARLCN